MNLSKQATKLREDYLNSQTFADLGLDRANTNEIVRLRQELFFNLFRSESATYEKALLEAPEHKANALIFSEAEVRIGDPDELSLQEQTQLLTQLQAFCPWKKGPFNIFGNTIDAEWRSDHKWDRILPHLMDIKDRTVADIGCNNGYFMFRLAAMSPRLVIGFEPYVKHWFNFQLLQKYARQDQLKMELLGVEHFHLLPDSFDLILCLGILYHHTDPIGLLRKMHSALKPGGQIIVDCQGISGSESHAFMPKGRYAKARGIWFLPTVSCLQSWIRRTHFREVECFFSEPLTINEQRRTTWADIESLSDFLNQEKTLTVEGYPAPWRHYIKAIK